MENKLLNEALINARFDELDMMIDKYNAIDCDVSVKKYEVFLKCLSYVVQLEEAGMLIKCKNKKYNISYLKTILDNDGPEYALKIGFYNPYRDKATYEIGVCVRGTPLLKKSNTSAKHQFIE